MKRARAILVATAAAFAGGCGGGGEPPPPPPVAEDGRLSRPELVRRANEVCARSEAAVALATRRGREVIDDGKVTGSSDDVVADALLTGARVIKPYQRRLRALKPPRNDARGWDRFLDRIEDAAALFPSLARAIRSRDGEELSELNTKFRRIATETRPYVEQYGLGRCLPDAV
ncbi:MAG: hypothetical protein ACR2ML_08995 [Solirubrobacteraceae bacterium]